MHVSVVNSYAAASLLVPVSCVSNVDLPTLHARKRGGAGDERGLGNGQVLIGVGFSGNKQSPEAYG